MRLQRIQNNSTLIIHDLQIQHELAQRLPASIARSYHVIPVTEETGRITVAMVNPGDGAALAAVRNALGSEPYIVRGDQELIDAAIDQVWPDEVEHAQPIKIILQIYDNESPKKNGGHHNREREVYEFTQKLASLLNAKLNIYSGGVEAGAEAFYKIIRDEHYDLLVCSQSARATLRRIPTSMLVVQKPAWPLNKILLLINGALYEEAVVNWGIRLAKVTNACITALAVAPPVPGMFHGLTGMQQGLPELLSTNTKLGRQTREIAKRLAEEQINGTIKLRYGSPEMQYLEEATDEHYDLIVIPAESGNRWKQWLLGELVTPLLRQSRSPVLVAKSMQRVCR
jgi:nucleotide-binding universal stress UspA family protein